MKAEIITIGDEILIGQIVDTNSAYIAKQFNKIGVDVFQISSVQDEEKHIKNALNEASSRADIILVTGGLGPTNDDITKKTLCRYFNDEMVLDNAVLANVEAIFSKYSDQPISELNRSQALIPSKAIALTNKYGTAPGMWFLENNKIYVSLPGVPFEMKALLDDEVIPRIKQQGKLPYILHKTILTYGVGESTIAEKIASWENALPSFVKLAYLPSLGKVRLRLSARGTDKALLVSEIDKQVARLHEIIGDIIRGYEDEASIEEQIASILTKQGKTLVTAESCTGGKIAAKFTSYPGASAYFKGGIVTYATITKTEVLNIPQEIIEKYSVVSAEITAEMAKRAQKLFHADYAIATTGNAGPTKGDSDAEIGTVFISLAGPTTQKTHQFQLGNQREKVTEKAVNKAMELLWEELT